jgi:subtilisin-like proprotein convertase family protein
MIPERGAATPYPSAVSVSGLGAVTDVDLKLDGFSHEYPYDVEVELVGPSGASARLMSDVGGSSEVSNVNLTFDDEATSAVPNPLSSGTFRPSSPLSVFDGTNPNGVWELYVDDTSGGDAGRIPGGWSLTITSEGTVEPPPTDTTTPDTTLRETPSTLSNDVNTQLAFRSSETGSTFECKLDGAAFQSCTAPKRYFLLSDGQHTFQVRAKDASGNVDQTPAEHTWTVDSLDPMITFSERPGNATGPSRWDEWVTNDRSPTWAWTIEDPNLGPASEDCELYDDTNDRYILDSAQCSSPFTFGGELPDADYYFDVSAEDSAGNYNSVTNYFEVDTVAPRFVSGTPTGRRAPYVGEIAVTFDDTVYAPTKSVNLYRKGSNKPIAADTYGDGSKRIRLSTDRVLRRDTWYTVKITTGVTDGANNLEAPKTWNFKTK